MMALGRQKHWATRAYHNFLLERAKVPFAWGSNDCALFAADGILANTGVDIAADFRGKYTDEAGALAAIKAITGGTTVADAAAWCAQKHGLAELAHPLTARRGDLVVFEGQTGSLVAGLVHLNGSSLVSVGEAGLYQFSIRRVKRAWHYE
ncbi:DUF6950 family protein [Telmatobacter bradus]|uniref:DUF6950 family protein n=1 Tax=Telmatobacter bradus TaxID=474953 RepID=UPI003B428F52